MAFDWNQFQTESSSSQQFDWNQFAPEPSEEEENKRHVARSVSRYAEGFWGAGGDLQSAVTLGADWLLEKATGKKPAALPNLSKLNPHLIKLPTSEELRETSERLTGGYTKAKNSAEELSDAIFTDLGGFTFPGIAGKIPFYRAAVAAVGGNLASEATKALGFDSTTQGITKAAASIFSTIYKPRFARGIKNDLYAKAKSLRPEQAEIASENLLDKATNLVKKLESGGSSAAKNPALTKAREFQEALLKTKNSTGLPSISINELEEFQRTMNTTRQTLFKEVGGLKEGKKLANHYLDEVDDVIKSATKRYAQVNPEWYDVYKKANGVHAAIESSKKLSRIVWGAAKDHKLKGSALALAGLLFAPGKFLTTAGAASAGYLGLKTTELLTRIMKKSELRKMYLKTLKDGTQGNSALIAKDIADLDAALQKEINRPQKQ